MGAIFAHTCNSKCFNTMKKRYALSLFTVTAIFASSATAQIVEVRNANGDLLNSTLVQVTEPVGDSTQTMGFGAPVENVSGSSRTINLKRYEVDVPHGTGNYFCWDLCYGERSAGQSPLWIGADPVPMNAGFIANGFHAYHKPYTTVGTATFRYVWYDVNSPNDSVWVDIQFNALLVGIHENASPVRSFSAFPNPAVSSDITINFDLATPVAGTQLAVYNMLGERKLVRALNVAQGKVVIGKDELPAGVWFASLEQNGRALVTKRVVVQ